MILAEFWSLGIGVLVVNVLYSALLVWYICISHFLHITEITQTSIQSCYNFLSSDCPSVCPTVSKLVLNTFQKLLEELHPNFKKWSVPSLFVHTVSIISVH